ncbi:MAG: cyclic nucleotide-binding domain-containing protein [Bacteriovoracaceae bacterium]|nr:cyclic nucleotide-binding domain-containing protein [Bacteriovoracaceae bacterium]
MTQMMLRQSKLSKKELVWQSLVFTLLAYTALEVPLNFAIQLPFETWNIALDILISIIFTIDLIKNNRFRRGLLKAPRRLNSYNVKNIPWYMSKFFWFDLIACIPYDAIAFYFGLHTYVRFLRLLKFGRLLKAATLNRNVGSFSVLPSGIKFEVIIICSIIAINCIACGWILVNPLEEVDIYTHYNKSLYWAITTLTTIGYGDIVPTNNIGRIYTMITMIIGVGVYGFVIGNVFNLISQADRYKEQTKEKFHDLSLFMKHYDIPEQLQYAVFSYYNHLYTKRLSDNDTKIIGELPNALQNELQTYMNMKLIGNVPSFKLCSHACLKAIAGSLEQIFFSPGQKIIIQGEIGYEMFIIAHGVVDVSLSEKGTVASLHEGQCFGEVALLEETKRSADVKAQTYCDLYKLSKEDFSRIVKSHPELEKSVKRVMTKKCS